jgi:hypothetical protein
MKVRWSRREMLVKSLIAAGGAIAAKISGVVPEFGWVAQAGSADQSPPPDYMKKALQQQEITGRDRNALLARVSASGDIREVLSQRGFAAVDLTKLNHHAVRSVMDDGTVVMAVSAVLPDQEHVIVHYQFGAGPRTTALIYRVTSDRKAELVAGSADGRPMRPMKQTADVSSNTVLAAGCPHCYHSCGSTCCGYDWWGILECCTFCAAFFECPPCFLACALTWCSGCVWFHCNHCANCCQDWWCF